MRMGIIAIAALLSGCATAKPTYLPDGRQGMAINCSGSALSWDVCYQKAGEVCGSRGYDVISQTGDTGSTIGGGPYAVYGGSIITRTLLIGCKAPKTE